MSLQAFHPQDPTDRKLPLLTFGQAVWLLLAGVLVVAGSWSAPFTSYDDTAHISANPRLAPEVPWGSYFRPQPDEAYMPLTLCSWRLDHWLWAGWMPQRLGSWAPGVRTVNLLLHLLAALLLLAIARELGLSPGEGLFLALAFAVHPTACESVCWATERKNVLAGFFSFLTLFLWIRLDPAAGYSRWVSASRSSGADRTGGTFRRTVVCTATYTLALLSKQAALGILPVLLGLEWLGGARALAGRPQPEGSLPRAWLARAVLFVPLLLVTAGFVWLGIEGHRSYLVPPPGGTVGTALLTDLSIAVRYGINLLYPLELSAAYGVAPLTSCSDPRVLWAAGVLVGTLALSLWLGRSRRRVLFGWLWFFGALGPSWNLVAIPYPMADRYLYLALPGFFLVLLEVAQGFLAGLRSDRQARSLARPSRILPITAAAYLALLGALAFQRGFVWVSSYTIFADAVAKEPRSAFARYGLGLAHAAAWSERKQAAGSEARPEVLFERGRWFEEWEALFETVDVDRQLRRAEVAFILGERYEREGNLERATRFYREAARTVPGVAALPEYQAQACYKLGRLALAAGDLAGAQSAFDRALQLQPENPGYRYQRAKTLLLRAAKSAAAGGPEAIGLRRAAQEDLRRIPRQSPWYAKARELSGGD